MYLNIMLTVIVVLTTVAVLFIIFKKKDDYEEIEIPIVHNIEYLQKGIVDTFNTILKTNIGDLNLNRVESEKAEANKTKLRNALKTCCYGDIGSKIYIQDRIKDLMLQKLGVTEENINEAIHFDEPFAMTAADKFDIILYLYKCDYGLQALPHLLDDWRLVEPKYDESDAVYYEITSTEIEEVYSRMDINLDFADKLEIVAQRIYQLYKGHGVIDEIRDMKIDGVSAGVSGIPETMYAFEEDIPEKDRIAYNADDPSLPLVSYNAIWMMYHGKTVHLSFLGFGSMKELQRVTKNVYRYDNPGQLSSDRGFIVNNMFDGSRVVAMRPPFSETWGFWVRKFDSADKMGITDLIKGKNAWIAIETLKWCIKGRRVLAITGGQGTGKTTLLGSLIQFASPALTLRIQELAPELGLRKAYPKRNIMSLRETDTVDGQAGLDVQKKTDGNINILGEVATDRVAAWAIQMSRVGSDWTTFTHHAKTARELVLAFRDSLIRAGGGTNEKITEESVAGALHTNLHLTKDESGFRHIERFTEITPSEPEEYPVTVDAATIEYYRRTTDRRVFEVQDVFVWDTDGFKFVNPLRKETIEIIYRELNKDQRVEFEDYLRRMYAECGMEV